MTSDRQMIFYLIMLLVETRRQRNLVLAAYLHARMEMEEED